MDNIIDRLVRQAGISELNAMQRATIEAYPAAQDLLLLSPTGSGKTLAFLLPMVREIIEQTDGNDSRLRCMILSPSRELAQQTHEVLRKLVTGLRHTLLTGGHQLEEEQRHLNQHPHIVIGTPGRMLDHIRRGNITAEMLGLDTLIIDEFDKCLELGFQDEMTEIVESLHSMKRRMFVSATTGLDVAQWTAGHTPHTLDFLPALSADGESAASDRLKLYRITTPTPDRLDELHRLIASFNGENAIVFCNFRATAEGISQYLTNKGISTTCYHGALEQRDRERALFIFAAGCATTLCTTDLAARGLDLSLVRHVVHYELPHDAETFTHRNGRTARWDKEGAAYLFLQRDRAMPDYLPRKVEEYRLPDATSIKSEPSQFTPIYISLGKKEKISRGDVAGFCMKIGGLEKEEVGQIALFDHYSLVAISRKKANATIKTLNGAKIKGTKAKVEAAR